MAWIAKSYLIKIKEYQRGIKTDYLALCTNQESIALVLVWFLDQLTNEAKKKKKKNTGIFKTIIGPTLYFQSLNDWWSRIPGTFLKRINFTFISPLCREIIPMDGLIAQSVLFLCVPKCVSYQLISGKVWVFFCFIILLGRKPPMCMVHLMKQSPCSTWVCFVVCWISIWKYSQQEY